MKKLPFKKSDVIAINTWLACATLDLSETAAQVALDNAKSCMGDYDSMRSSTEEECFDWVKNLVSRALFDRPVILLKPCQPEQGDERFYNKDRELFISLDELEDYLLAYINATDEQAYDYDYYGYYTTRDPYFPLNRAIWDGFLFDGLVEALRPQLEDLLDELYAEAASAVAEGNEEFVSDLIDSLYTNED